MDNIKANQTQKMDGLVLLSKIKDETIKLAFLILNIEVSLIN